jgi:hypothetical protein
VTLRPIAPRVVSLLLLALLLLNIADSFCTVIAVTSGVGREVNPLMDWLIDNSVTAFIVFKMAIGPVVVVPLWFFRRRKFAAYGTLVVVTLYFLVCSIHLFGLLTTGIIPGIGPV